MQNCLLRLHDFLHIQYARYMDVIGKHFESQRHQADRSRSTFIRVDVVRPLSVLTSQEMGLVNEWVSETIFNTLFISFVVWTFSPFWTATKRFYTAVIYARLLMVLCGAWTLHRDAGAEDCR